MKYLPGSLLVLTCLAVFVSPFAPLAHAGEALLGKLVVSDGGTTANRCTGWEAYAGAGSFVVTPLTKISIVCDSTAYVLTDVAGCDAGNCVKLAADQFFTTSVNVAKNLTCKAFASDGGVAGHAVTYNGGWVAMSPDPGAGAGAVTTCRVYSRKGDE